MHTVVELEQFTRSARKARVTEEEVNDIIGFLATDPTVGEIIAGTGGARKLRFKGRGKGTSGGYRVVTFYRGIAMPVFLIDVFAEGEKINYSESEKIRVKEVLTRVAKAYKRGPS